MNQNHLFWYLPIGLAEDLQRLKMQGEFEQAVRLIDLRLKEENIPQQMKYAMMAEREIMRRLPAEYPYTIEQAMEHIRREIPDFSLGEFEALMDAGRIDWLYLHGQVRILSSFFATLKKTDPRIAQRAGQLQSGGQEHHLDRAAQMIEQNGQFGCRLRIRASVKIRDEAFSPGKKVRVWLPIPAACRQQSDIRILSSFPAITFLAPENALQRTAYFEEVMWENHSFEVEYEYSNIVQAARPGSGMQMPPAPMDLGECAPHILFTPCLRSLCQELCRGRETPLQKAQAFYDFITTKVKYAFVREYFGITSIAEACARSLRGDCGVQALLFITLCRCAGIPARWQSGLYAGPDHIGPHDWAEFYAEPFGWLYCDPSFGGGAYRAGNEGRRRFYFGGMDPYRMVANTAIYADFQPPSQGFRADPYDNQSGEIEVEGRGLRYQEYERTRSLICIKELP